MWHNGQILFVKHGLHDFVHIHRTLRSCEGNFKQCMVIFITPTFVILAVYFLIYCKPCIILFLSSTEPVIKKFPTSLYIVLLHGAHWCEIFLQKYWWCLFFVQVLQMNTLPNIKHFLHALTCCIWDIHTTGYACQVPVLVRWCNINLTYRAWGSLFVTMHGQLIKNTPYRSTELPCTFHVFWKVNEVWDKASDTISDSYFATNLQSEAIQA
jgi:hypothetical protein